MNISEAYEEIILSYLAFVNSNKSIPTLADLKKLGISRDKVKHHFGNITELTDHLRKHYPEEMSVIVDESIFTVERFERLKKEVKKHRKFVVTTAVVGKSVHASFMASLKNYCHRNKAMLLILPCADKGSIRTHSSWTLDSSLKNEHLVFNNVALNDNLFISSIRLSAKQVNPLTGLSRIGQRNGSFVYASPKQFLEFVATSNRKKIPHALMTTGAVTNMEYITDKFMTNRTSYIADHDHVLGAIVIELEDDREFHFRQIQADNKTGSFIDLGKRYHANGALDLVRPEAFAMGDYHVGDTDPIAKQAWKEICKEIKPKNLILHDFFNGHSVNHHDDEKPLTKAKKSMTGRSSLDVELMDNARELEELAGWISGKLIRVKSNHDEFLDKYLTRGRYVDDPQNHYTALSLAKALLDGQDPFEFAINSINPKLKKKIVWLQRDEEYKISGIECGAHGDKGANGAKGSMNSVEKAYGNCVIGHSHSAGIIRGVYRVGTSSFLQLDYNSGPSSWAHTSCLIYPNGSRQLVSVIGGKWRSK